MNTDPLAGMFPLPQGIKIRSPRFADNPFTPHLQVDANNVDPAAARVPFTISWEEQKQGITADVRESEEGHLIADVRCTNASLPDTAAVSVGLMGTTEWALIRKTIPLGPLTNGVRVGTKDFGALSAIVKEIGPQIGLIVFLLV